MIQSVGIDVVETDRIQEAYHRYGDRFLRRIYSLDEVAGLAEHPTEPSLYLAGRFAAKEAVMKALARFFDRGVALRDIEILNLPGGRPYVRLTSPLTEKLTGKRISISITHSGRYALATAVIEEEE